MKRFNRTRFVARAAEHVLRDQSIIGTLGLLAARHFHLTAGAERRGTRPIFRGSFDE